jgi:hypothetical protein
LSGKEMKGLAAAIEDVREATGHEIITTEELISHL